MPATILRFALLFVLCLLYQTSSFRRNLWTDVIGTVLGFAILGTVVATFAFDGWVWGLASVIATFTFMAMVRPAVAREAGVRSSSFAGYGDDRFFDQFQTDEEVEFCLRQIAHEKRLQDVRLEEIARQPGIAHVLRCHGATSREYGNLFSCLCECSLGDRAWDILATPSDLDALFRLKKAGMTPQQVFTHFRRPRR